MAGACWRRHPPQIEPLLPNRGDTLPIFLRGEAGGGAGSRCAVGADRLRERKGAHGEETGGDEMGGRAAAKPGPRKTDPPSVFWEPGRVR